HRPGMLTERQRQALSALSGIFRGLIEKPRFDAFGVRAAKRNLHVSDVLQLEQMSGDLRPVFQADDLHRELPRNPVSTNDYGLFSESSVVTASFVRPETSIRSSVTPAV